MLFNSYTFFIFLFIVLVVSRLINSWNLRKIFLLMASYVFYAAWDPPFVCLLWISTLTDWMIAKRMYKTKLLGQKRFFLVLSLTVNLGMLGYFKYGSFILENFVLLLNGLGIHYIPQELNIILPIGISFYTFQTLSYSFDVYRGESKPWFSFLDYALYVSFFPQLVAGPIVRSNNFLPQCVHEKKGSIDQIGKGLALFVIGLFNKIVIADTLMAPIVQKIYDSTILPTFSEAWAATLAFSVQIFCDFAGYSTCAIGIGLTMGFFLPKNFRFPYAAVGFSDFWKRWHITLSTWFRDYLYIPLGGNRKGNLRTYANVLLTMLIGGLWHGASWLFVIWGGLHGVYLVLERGLKKLSISKHALWQKKHIQLALSMITFFFVSLAWVFFRAEHPKRALEIVSAMLGTHSHARSHNLRLFIYHYYEVIIITLLMLGIHWFLRNSTLEDIIKKIPWWIQSLAISLLAYFVVISMSGENNAFIYFQF